MLTITNPDGSVETKDLRFTDYQYVVIDKNADGTYSYTPDQRPWVPSPDYNGSDQQNYPVDKNHPGAGIAVVTPMTTDMIPTHTGYVANIVLDEGSSEIPAATIDSLGTHVENQGLWNELTQEQSTTNIGTVFNVKVTYHTDSGSQAAKNTLTINGSFSDNDSYYNGKNNLNASLQYTDQNGDPFPLPTEIKNQLKGALSSDDFTVTHQGESSAVDPIAVGTYTVTLKPESVAKIQNIFKNYTGDKQFNYRLLFSKTSFTYTVKARKATISIDNGGQTSNWNGQPASLDLNKFKPVITDTTEGNTNLSLPSSVTLTKDDYNITPTNSTGVGEYTVSLTENGIQKIENAIDPASNRYKGQSNYNWTVGTSKLTINAVDANYKFSGSTTVHSIGTPSLDTLTKAITSTNTISGQPLNFSQLTLSDFDWYDSSTATTPMTSAPTKDGTYYLKLNSNGITAIKNANPGYNLTLGDNLYTYTIATTGTQTINYVDKEGNQKGSQVISGKTDQTVKVTPQVLAGKSLGQLQCQRRLRFQQPTRQLQLLLVTRSLP